MTESQSLTNADVELVRRHADFIVELLLDGDTFQRHELPDGDWVQRRLDKLRCNGLVETVGQRRVRGSRRNLYSVPAHVAEQAQTVVDGRRAPCPCGHHGFHNAGDHAECRYPGCDQSFALAEVEL